VKILTSDTASHTGPYGVNWETFVMDFLLEMDACRQACTLSVQASRLPAPSACRQAFSNVKRNIKEPKMRGNNTLVTLALNPRAFAPLAYFEYRAVGRLLRYARAAGPGRMNLLLR